MKPGWEVPQSYPIVDKKEQFQKIEGALLEGEKIFAVFDMKGGGTGFIGITSWRVIIYDKSFMRKMKAVVSIPYSRIYSVAAEDENGVFSGRGFYGTSKMVLKTAGDDFEFEFRGSDKAHIAHNLILSFMVRPVAH
jgi:hypothetical protein